MHPHDEPSQMLCTDLILIHSAMVDGFVNSPPTVTRLLPVRRQSLELTRQNAPPKPAACMISYTLKQIAFCHRHNAKIISMQCLSWAMAIFNVGFLGSVEYGT